VDEISEVLHVIAIEKKKKKTKGESTFRCPNLHHFGKVLSLLISIDLLNKLQNAIISRWHDKNCKVKKMTGWKE